MSLRLVESDCRSQVSLLGQTCARVADLWNDPVQDRFWKQFVLPLETDCACFLDAMGTLLDALEAIERDVQALDR